MDGIVGRVAVEAAAITASFDAAVGASVFVASGGGGARLSLSPPLDVALDASGRSVGVVGAGIGGDSGGGGGDGAVGAVFEGSAGPGHALGVLRAEGAPGDAPGAAAAAGRGKVSEEGRREGFGSFFSDDAAAAGAGEGGGGGSSIRARAPAGRVEVRVLSWSARVFEGLARAFGVADSRRPA